MRRALPILVLLLAAGGAAETEIRVLSYNTHGLAAWVAGDDPEARFPRIGELANGYDLVLLQEDFEHHERLRETARHGIIQRGNESRFSGSWWCWVNCAGSGLTLLSRFEPESLVALTNAPYGLCSGWISGASDCFATKGFQHARLRLPEGPILGVVNTHLDAGREEPDRATRAGQLESLRAYLAQAAADEPLIVAGDFNLDAASAEDKALLDGFSAALGLADSGARARPGSLWTVLDYIYVRDGDGVRLEVLGAGEDLDFVENEVPLSDHPAIFARIRVQWR